MLFGEDTRRLRENGARTGDMHRLETDLVVHVAYIATTNISLDKVRDVVQSDEFLVSDTREDIPGPWATDGDSQLINTL